ncbi:hypothetical protein [Myxosarcina sp. GI1(2024)]
MEQRPKKLLEQVRDAKAISEKEFPLFDNRLDRGLPQNQGKI